MNNTDSIKQKWNARYKNKLEIPDAARVLLDNQHLLPASGKALDLACGLGANALIMAAAGLETHAWDISDEALKNIDNYARKKCPDAHIVTLQRNVETQPPEKSSFDVIVVSQFLYRPICENIIDALRPGGLLFYQTFCREKITEIGPGKAEFLLKAGELLALFSSLDLVVYREERNCGDLSLGFRNQAYLVARKPG